MLTRLTCPYCQTLCQVEGPVAGVTLRCSRCGQLFTAAPPRPTPAAEVVRHEPAGVTSPGRVRDNNEDCFLLQHLSWAELNVPREMVLAIVADGLGGHQGGEKASSLTINALHRSLAPVLLDLMASPQDAASVPQMHDHLLASLRGVNQAVYHQSQTHPECQGMGATAAVVLISGKHAAIAHVGDCRVYHARGGQVTPVTQDQTEVARLIERGHLRPEQARNHPQRNEITQAVGTQETLTPSFLHLTLAAGDWLIAASDGLHEHVDDAMLTNALRNKGTSASALAAELVHLANREGGTDNCTVVVIRCH